MYVIKRDGQRQEVHFDKITERIRKLCWGLSDTIDPVIVAQKVCLGIYQGVHTYELDELASQTCAYKASEHPDYSLLAARIVVSNLHKNTKSLFSSVIHDLYTYIDPKTNLNGSLIANDVYDIIMKHKDTLNNAIDYNRDYNYEYYGFKTLERPYLLRLNGAIVERPQHLLMRVAVGIHKGDIDKGIETYHLMSEGWFTHASPTLFNSGTPRPQMSSCFLLTMKEDSIEGIFDTLKQCALISKSAGGIGLAIHDIRAQGSYIKGTNGTSNGIVPMLKVFNDTARYVDQGGGKRKGSFALYLEPHHADIFEFLDLRKNHGAEEMRARDLFYALWISDLFMERVKSDKHWSLMCPSQCTGLSDTYGDVYKTLYESYESQGKYVRQIQARELWQAIITSQIETGTPYMLYKDHINNKSNHKHLGTIKSSNLCCEIVEYTSPDEVAVCNLASIALNKYVTETLDGPIYDYKKLYEVTKVITRNLNKIIDNNYYPVIEARNSNMRHRPIGIGVQGLADAFIKLRLPFESQEAQRVNKAIFETIYYGALDASCELAEQYGAYESYEGSPFSQGILQFDMWNGVELSGLWAWDTLKQRIAQYGVRNSLLTAPMPTASTSNILGNNECFEPYTSNIYVRRLLSGEFWIVNKHLLNDLMDIGMWNEGMRNKLIEHKGSVQKIDGIPSKLKEIYKTVWEMSQKTLIKMSADRAPFIDQTQSLNLFVKEATYQKLTSAHFYGWSLGLKTGQYYLRTQAAVDAIQFTVEKKVDKEISEVDIAKKVCSIQNREECDMCGS